MFGSRETRRQLHRLNMKMDWLMSNFEDLQAALSTIGDKVTNVKGDVEGLLAKITELQSNPPTGMTPEQQASLDAAVTSAQNVAAQLTTLDDLVPAPAAPQPPVDEQPAPTTEQPAADAPTPQADPDHPTA